MQTSFRITYNILSCGLGNFFIIYQKNMIMSFVNTEIVSKHRDAMIFFPHTQGIIYHFKDNYTSSMFNLIFRDIVTERSERSSTQVAGIKQTIEKVFDKNTPLPERILTLIREQIVTIISALATLLAGIATIVLSVIGDFRGADALKRLAGKTVVTLPAIVGSVIAATLGFLGKAVGFVAEHTWALIVFVVGLVGWWLMQKVKKD